MRIAPCVSVLMLASVLPACGNQDPRTLTEDTDQRSEPIIGGVLDSDTSHDGVVLLYAQSGGMCTGSIISQPGQKGVIITARHCVSNVVSEYVTCQNDVSGDLNPGSIYILKGTSPNENNVIGRGEKLFHVGGTSLCNADIAVMVMQGTVSGIQPLRVRTEKSTAIGEKFMAIGYGLTNPDVQYSAGRRYIRENVSVTDLGPKYYGLYEREFLGTTSICQGDSGGPAISSDYAVMGVTSRGGDCYGNDNIWTRPDGFVELVDEAMVYAGSTYQDEAGNLHDGTGAGGTGGSGGAGGTGGTGGSGGTAGTGATGGAGGTGGDTPGTGGTENPGPSCGDQGPCPPDATCVVDPASNAQVCGMTCNDAIPCPQGAVCDPSLGVCVHEETVPTSNADSGASSDGSCGVVSPRGSAKGGLAGLVLVGLGLTALRRRRR